MTMQFKDTYREWNEKVQPSEELLSRLLTEASQITEASEISAAEESAKRHKKWNDKVRENKIRENKIRENKIQDKQNHNRRWSRGIAWAAGLLLVINVSLPVLAGTFPTIYELMYLVSPAVAQFYQPVQLSDEYDGIRMEVVAAYIHEETADIYLTLQDL